jgi:SAM-dependent methyltransferase
VDEASKTRRIRGPEFDAKYLGGRVIDIGAGSDPVCPWAEVFDLADGDANFISRYRAPESYDTVHSSHCLEHLFRPAEALSEWWKLIKPGGFLVLVVPDEDLYEQGFWPSMFNPDHKATFRLHGGPSWSPVSFNGRELVQSLPGAFLIAAELQDAGYNHHLNFRGRKRRRLMGFRTLKSVARRIPGVGPKLKRRLEEIGVSWGIPLDQTTRDAVAQIQIIAQKARHP